jgi:hypothetical protein
MFCSRHADDFEREPRLDDEPKDQGCAILLSFEKDGCIILPLGCYAESRCITPRTGMFYSMTPHKT